MATLTWRNVDAPNFSGALDGYRTFSGLLNAAGDTATRALGTYESALTTEADRNALQNLQRLQDPFAARSALQSGSVYEGVDQRRVSPETLKGMNDYVGNLVKTSNDLNVYQQAERNRAALEAGGQDVNNLLISAMQGNPVFGSNLGKLTPDQLSKVADTYRDITVANNNRNLNNLAVNDKLTAQAAIPIVGSIVPKVFGANDLDRVVNSDPAYLGASPAVRAQVDAQLKDRFGRYPFAPQDGVQKGIAEGTQSASGNVPMPGNLPYPSQFGVSQDNLKRLNVVQIPDVVQNTIRDVSGNDQAKSAFLSSVFKIENRGNKSPNSDAVSNKGATGFWQFMESTGKQYGLNTDADRKDPVKSTIAASKYYDDLYKRYDGNQLAMAAEYNGGKPAATAVLSGKEPPAQETKDYLGMFQELSKPVGTDSFRPLFKTTGDIETGYGAAKATIARYLADKSGGGGLARLIDAGVNLTTPTDVGAGISKLMKDLPEADAIGTVNRIMREQGVSAAVAGAIILDGGLDVRKGPGILRARAAKDWLLGDPLTNTPYVEDSDLISAKAKAYKNTTAPQDQAAVINEAKRASSVLQETYDKYAASYDNYQKILAASQYRPELADAVKLAESQLMGNISKFDAAVRSINKLGSSSVPEPKKELKAPAISFSIGNSIRDTRTQEGFRLLDPVAQEALPRNRLVDYFLSK